MPITDDKHSAYLDLHGIKCKLTNLLNMHHIPVLNLSTIHQFLDTPHNVRRQFLLHTFTFQNPPKWGINRMEVYFICLLYKGDLKVEFDLMSLQIQAPALLALAPSVIRNFVMGSDDFCCDVIFFEKAFFIQPLTDVSYLDKYDFFHNKNSHLIPITTANLERFTAYFDIVKNQVSNPGIFLNDIARHILHILLYEIAEFTVSKKEDLTYTHKQLIPFEFKKNLDQHYRRERKVIFYASLQHVTSKYFSDVIQQETGKTAGEMIDEKIILEARVLLQNKDLTIAQIADTIGFEEPSHFSKYFKNLTGYSPLQYRRTLS